MKRIAIEELASKLPELIATSPKEQVLLTRDGKPFAFVSDASKYDWEDIGYMTDPEFWKMIEQRRRERGPGIALSELEKEIEGRERAEGRKPQVKRSDNGKRKAG